MTSAKVTSKGQITIPADVRLKLGLRPGSRVEFVPMDDGAYQVRVPSRSVRDAKGSVPHAGQPVSIEDMDDAIASSAVDSLR